MTKTKNKTTSAFPATVTDEHLPAVAYDYGTDAGTGVDDITQQEAGIPFIKVLQAQSPEVHGSAKIEGAAAGMFLHTGTGELLETLNFVPAVRQHLFVEWVPREKGGGFRGIYDVNSDVVSQAIDSSQEFGKYKTAAGNDLVETFYLYGYLVDEDGNPTSVGVLAFTSASIKRYRKQFAGPVKHCLVNGKRPPIFGHQLQIGTVSETNEKGTWYNFDITFAVKNNVKASLLPPDSVAYQAAKMLNAAVTGGEVKADFESQEPAGGASDEGTSAF